MRKTLLAIPIALALCHGAPAFAQQAWDYDLTLYSWLAGLSGDVSTVPGLPPANIDYSFGDILDDLEGSAMFYGQARNGPWSILLDATYVHTASNAVIGGPVVNMLQVDTKMATLGLGVGHELEAGPKARLDGYIGARAWWVDTTYTVITPVGGTPRGNEKSWVDPIVGLSGEYAINDRWNLFGNVEIGGFGIGADFESTVLAGASYAFSDLFSVSLAWRHLSVDYDNDGDVFDVTQSGPLIGASFHF